MKARFLGAALAAILLIFCSPAISYAYFEEEFLSEMFGEVLVLDNGQVQLAGIVLPETDADMEEILLYAENAQIFDLMSGCPGVLEDITPGMYVRATFNPETNQVGDLYLDAGEPGAAAFKTTVSENIQYAEDGCAFITGDGKYRIILRADTNITDADDGFYDAHDIRPGMSMFIWVDMVTASFPALAFPEKVVLINPDF